jgi:hypothetical protein
MILVIKLNIVLDFDEFNAVIKFKVFGLSIFIIKINLLELTYKTNYSKKRRSLNLVVVKEQEYLIRQIKKSILDKLYYDDIVIEYQFSIHDKCLMANLSGVIDLVLFYLQIYLKNRNKDTEIAVYNKINFVEKKNVVRIYIKVLFTMFDMLFAIIMSFYKRGRYVREKNKAAR